ncbi:hypothetical protein CANINC_003537 [Pichia inconspicua]|uniref:Small ribosomal subunit protein mS41 n=1 Tax=Pichia inconspicua TaxID=52247 RepID=A0A4T0WYE7_9ASCO|nr:hypothetical protein CANINC_003537 [[Candida] inconspicua]
MNSLTFTRLFSSTCSLLRASTSSIPKPTDQIPDVQTFLTKIGRNTVEYQSAFPTWDSLFTATSKDLKSAGVDVPARRYILHQVEKFKRSNDVQPTSKSVKKNGGERKFNQYLAQKRILDRIHTAQQLKQYRKQLKLTQMQYNRFDKIHRDLGHSL